MKSKILYLVTLALAALSLALPLFALSGCIQSPMKGGKAKTTSRPGELAQDISQSENPAQASAQTQEVDESKTYTVPAGSIVRSGDASNRSELLLSLPMPIIEKRSVHARTDLGAAQKDTGREIAAKLASLKGVVWVGVVLFIFGVVSFFWPPLKLIIGSVTTSAAISAGGLALIFLPAMIVGNELLIMFVVLAIVGAWWFAHRHGAAQATVKALREQLGK